MFLKDASHPGYCVDLIVIGEMLEEILSTLVVCLSLSFVFLSFCFQISEKVNVVYLAYSKEYGYVLQNLRSLQQQGIHSNPQEEQQMYNFLAAPLTHMCEYPLKFAPLFDCLENTTKKSLNVTMKSLNDLHRKCQTEMISKVFGV